MKYVHGVFLFCLLICIAGCGSEGGQLLSRMDRLVIEPDSPQQEAIVLEGELLEELKGQLERKKSPTGIRFVSPSDNGYIEVDGERYPVVVSQIKDASSTGIIEWCLTSTTLQIDISQIAGWFSLQTRVLCLY